MELRDDGIEPAIEGKLLEAMTRPRAILNLVENEDGQPSSKMLFGKRAERSGRRSFTFRLP